MGQPLVLRFSMLALLSGVSCAGMCGQSQNPQPTAACPLQPATVAAMRGCYRPVLVFAPALDNPLLLEQLNQLKSQPAEFKTRAMLYVPIVPEGHNQPIPGSKIPTARLSEDELAAMRHRFKVEPADFMVVLIGRDGGEKLNSSSPVPMDQLKRLIDSMPARKVEMRQEPQGQE